MTDVYHAVVRSVFAVAWLFTAALIAAPQQSAPGQQPGPQQPSRDTSAQQNQEAPPAPQGRITGRVLAADNGRPIKRARVFINAAELSGGRGTLTDDQGVFDFTELPAGRYSVNASKAGFVQLSYGQRRPLTAGTPLQLLDGQQLKGVDFRLPRGSVVAGSVFDEDGEPMPGVSVRVMRYQYLQGERRLTPAGSAQTDDKGQYRVWGLMPGDYYVNALARNFNVGGFGGRGGGGGFGGPGGGRGVRGGFGGAAASSDDEDALAYAPTYYPGVPNVSDAKAVAVGLAQEVLDITFNMQLVRASRISGHVTNPDGSDVSSGNVNLANEGTSARAQVGVNFGSRIDWDGSFSIPNVPPGRYVMRARGTDSDTPQYAATPLTVDGQDIDDVTIILTPGATLSGTVTLLPGSSPSPDITNIRITAPPTDQESFGPQQNARVERDGHFTLEGVPAGSHLLRPSGNTHGWVLKSVTVGARDVTDTPIQLRSGESVSNVAIVFTDQLTEINGTITTNQGDPMPDYTILAFTTDSSLWRAQSRQIMTTRPDQTGKFKIRGLPPGDYYVIPVDPAEQGEWFEPTYLDDHRAGAARVTLTDGDVKTHDFKIGLK